MWWSPNSWIGVKTRMEMRGVAFCIMCAWFLRLLTRGTERHCQGSVSPHKSQFLCAFLRSSCPLPVPGDTWGRWWVMPCMWSTSRKTKSSFLFYWFLSILEKETQQPLPSDKVREDKCFTDVFSIEIRLVWGWAWEEDSGGISHLITLSRAWVTGSCVMLALHISFCTSCCGVARSCTGRNSCFRPLVWT